MLNNLIKFEQDYWTRNELVLGIDEAGYGCLAGSMYIAGTIFPMNFEVPLELAKVADSKKIKESTRFELMKQIRHYALDFFVIKVDVSTINEHNPYWLRYTAARDYISKTIFKTSHNIRVIYDGDRSIDGITWPSEALIKGDAKSFSIAAASILAKTAKDLEMIELSRTLPMYKFESNKGYGTAEHIAAIQKHGLSEVHRIQYCSKYI